MRSRIDTPHHYWGADRADYHWMSPAVQPLCRDFLPADLAPHLRKHRIDQTIVVQAAQTVAETDYLLALVENDPATAGVAGGLGLRRADCPPRLDRTRPHPQSL